MITTVSDLIWMGGTKSRNGDMSNEKLEMRKWKQKWKLSSLLLVDNTDVDAINPILIHVGQDPR